MKCRRSLFIFCIFVFSLSFSAAEAATVIKFATLAPKGSSWDKVMTDYSNEVKAKTGGAVTFEIYPGGVMGDEPDMEKKLRLGQIHAAGFTGVGLGKINMAIRVMESPMLFKSYDQVDSAFAAVGGDLEKLLSEKGYTLLGWAHPGMIKLFSKLAIDSHKALQGAKVWIWSGDPIAEAMKKALGFNGIPLGLPDVLTSLQTGMIDTVYAPGLACLALQWYTKTKHMTDINLGHSMGAMIIRNDVLNKMSGAHQQVVKSLGREYMRKLTTQTRSENEEAVSAMKSSGINIVALTPENYQELYDASQKVVSELAGTLFPKALLDKVKGAI